MRFTKILIYIIFVSLFTTSPVLSVLPEASGPGSYPFKLLHSTDSTRTGFRLGTGDNMLQLKYTDGSRGIWIVHSSVAKHNVVRTVIPNDGSAVTSSNVEIVTNSPNNSNFVYFWKEGLLAIVYKWNVTPFMQFIEMNSDLSNPQIIKSVHFSNSITGANVLGIHTTLSTGIHVCQDWNFGYSNGFYLMIYNFNGITSAPAGNFGAFKPVSRGRVGGAALDWFPLNISEMYESDGTNSLHNIIMVVERGAGATDPGKRELVIMQFNDPLDESLQTYNNNPVPFPAHTFTVESTGQNFITTTTSEHFDFTLRTSTDFPSLIIVSGYYSDNDFTIFEYDGTTLTPKDNSLERSYYYPDGTLAPRRAQTFTEIWNHMISEINVLQFIS